MKTFASLESALSHRDRSLMPLADCPRFEGLAIACAALRTEFDRLRQAAPQLVCDWFQPEIWRMLAPARAAA